MNRIREIIDYREMIFSLVRKDLRGRYKGSVLGFFWTFLNPLLQLIVYTLVFSIIMRAGIEDYYLFLFVALVPWSFFSASVTIGSGSIRAQQDMVKKIYFPREVLPISCVLSQLINMLLTFIVVFLVLIVTGKGVNLFACLYLIPVILVETLLALGMAFLTSAVTVYFRDLEYMLGIIMMAWQFASPVMYSISMVPERFIPLFKLNPMTSVITAYREILYYKTIPDLSNLLTAVLIGVAILILGVVVFEKLSKHFAEEM